MDTGPKQLRQINPRHNANIFSILTFGWTLETFKLGYTRDIQDTDLYAPLPEHRSDVLGDVIQRAWEREVELNRQRSSKPSLWKVLLKVFGCEYMLYGLILAAMEFIIRLQQPLFLGLLLRYYSPAQDLHNSTANSTYYNRLFSYYDTEGYVSWGEAVFFSFGVVFCSALNIMVQHPFMMGVMHIGMKMRVGICSLIYRKALKINIQSMSENSGGLVVNLMANDVNRFDSGPLFAHYLWIGPLETLLMTVYLYREMGWAAAYGALIIIAVVPFQIFLGTRTAYYRRGTAIKSDERVKLMKEIIMGIEVIKMYTWEKPFRKIIDIVRRQEIYFIKRTSYIRGVIMSFIMFTSRFGIFITILFFVTHVNRITVESVFFLTCYYNIIKQTMTLYFPQAVGQLAEMKVAVQRIRDYLLIKECQLPPREFTETNVVKNNNNEKRDTIVIELLEPPVPPNHVSSTSQNKQENNEEAIVFEGAYSRWIKSSEKEDVEDINFTIFSGSLTTIIGAVGSGKSTLLHMVLGELPCSHGSLKTIGTVSYASQEPWLFVGSIRQNILFGQPFVKARYMNVCKICALERDISLFPHGDKTVVGERGVSLSGGQRARINLARTVYKEADIYLLDDPLSAVDTQVAKHIFDRCIKRYLQEKTVVLVTHQLQFIKSVDKIVIMDKGKILAEGDFENLNEQGLSIIQLMENKTREVHEDNATGSPQTLSMNQFQGLSTLSLHKRRLSFLLDESSTLIIVTTNDSFGYIHNADSLQIGGHTYMAFFYMAGFLTIFSFVPPPDQRPEAELQTTGRVQGSIYREYFLAGGIAPYVVVVLLMFIIAQGCASSCDYWLSRWSSVEDQLTGDPTVDNIMWSELGLQRNSYVIIFGIITIATVVAALIRAFMFFSLCMKSSVKLHDKMFDCISRSPMSFFHKNPSGRILNRFSKDMGAIDELLPQAMIDCFQIILNLVGVLLVILVIDITLLIPIAAALIIFYIFRIIFIRTSGAVKRLEGITRSPVFGHINATVLGLATIRSFGAEALLAEEFDRHQDLHSAAWYLFITCSRAFGYFLDIICLLFIICVTFGCLMKTDHEASYVGLAITQSISLTGIFQWGMRQSAEMENQMTSVERVLEYIQLPKETTFANIQKPPQNWPTEGAIHFNNVSMKYAPNGNHILQNLQFTIQPQEKIGIVGRTGAGKSSIIQALFRLAYLDGTITIDNIDISTLELCDLREKISIIPQEPVLFSGSMRKNLDPFNEYPDEVLLEALKSVELITGDDALNKEVQEGGLNFSVGERQLVCLARAIVRKNKILLLDEATANVDAQTDALIQTAIRKHFTTCTVFTIAHRLNTVIDSDKILVLDAGRMQEFDHPYTLLKNKKGEFRKMVVQTGPTIAPMLFKLAARSYKKMTEQ